MCQSMVNIQSPTAEIRRGKKEEDRQIERNYRMKILWSALLHRATINSAPMASFGTLKWKSLQGILINTRATMYYNTKVGGIICQATEAAQRQAAPSYELGQQQIFKVALLPVSQRLCAEAADTQVTCANKYADCCRRGMNCKYASGVAKWSTSFGWGKGWNVTSAGWHVTLCDPIWHVSSSSGVVTSVSELLYPCYFIRVTIIQQMTYNFS